MVMLRILATGHTPRQALRLTSLAARPVFLRYFSVERATGRKRQTRNWTLPVIGLVTGVVSLFFFLPDPSRHAPTSSRKHLSATHFTPTVVVSNETSGPNTKILKLRVPPQLIPKDDPAGFSPIWSVFIKDDDIQVERPYTPLDGIDEEGNMTFWIKQYPSGEVGRWLHSKKPGDTIELRGPLKTWPWKEGEWDQVVLISGGTGITPFYQLIRQVFEHPLGNSQNTRFTLLHGSRTPEELPPKRILRPLLSYAESYPAKFNLKLFVDADNGSAPPVTVPPLETGHISDVHLKRILGLPESAWWQRWLWGKASRPVIPERILFLVCGPEPMIAAIAGPYGRNFSQGPTLGILGRLGLTPSQVWKL